jgi:hypothetical protein
MSEEKYLEEIRQVWKSVVDSFRDTISEAAINLWFGELDILSFDGDVITSDSDTGVIKNETTGETYMTKPFPPFIGKIIADGGLMESIKKGNIR